MANLAKYNRSQIGGLTRHFERAQREDGSYYQFGNQDIDTSRTYLNYNLAPERDGGQLSFIGGRTSEVKCQNRADVNVMCSWVITAPKGLADDEHEKFFRESYKFLNERYAAGSDKNVISAYVHMDEVAPHLHYAFVPVVHDKKKGIDKVSAKIAVDRQDLQTFHQDLERRMAEVFGREIGILNEATKDGNKSIDELKRGTAQAEIAKIEALKTEAAENVSELRSEALELQRHVTTLKNESKRLEDMLEVLDGKIKTAQEVEAIISGAGKTLVGGYRTLTQQNLDDLKRTALASPRIKTEQELIAVNAENARLVEALQKEKSLKTRYKKKADAFDELEKERNRKPSFEESRELSQIKAFKALPEKARMEFLNAQRKFSGQPERKRQEIELD